MTDLPFHLMPKETRRKKGKETRVTRNPHPREDRRIYAFTG